MTRIIFLILLYFCPSFVFAQSDNPSAHLDESHIQIIRDNKRWFLRAGEDGAAVVCQDGEFTTSILGGDGGDSLRIEQVDSLFIIILYSGDTEIARDSGVIESGTGASTLAEVSAGSDDATKSLYTMTPTVPLEIESDDNNTIFYLDPVNERIGLKTASPAAALHLGSGALRITDLTASQIVATDANKDLQTLTTATYPSLTELSYSKGVTSSIQTQLTARPTGSGSSGYIPVWSSSTALGSSSMDENTGGYVTNITRGFSVGDLVASGAAGFGFRIQRGTMTAGFFSDGTNAYFRTNTNHGIRFGANLIDVISVRPAGGAYIGRINHLSDATNMLWIEDATFAASGSLSGSALKINQTWNTSAAVSAIDLNVTNIASGAASKLINLQIASVSQFHITKAGGLHALGSAGIGIVTPISKAHVYEDNSNTDSTVGLTVEQDGTGDAMLQYLLTGGRRWLSIVDNSDADKYKIVTDGLDYFEIDANAETMDLSIHGTEKISVSATKTNITNAIRYSGILDASVWAAQVDNWTPSGGDSCSIFLIEMTGGSQTITGMNLTNVSGLTVKLINEDGIDSIYIANENASSTSTYRFANEEGNDLIVPPGGCAECIYSPNVSRWRCWKLWFFLLPFRFRKREKIAA